MIGKALRVAKIATGEAEEESEDEAAKVQAAAERNRPAPQRQSQAQPPLCGSASATMLQLGSTLVGDPEGR